MIPVVFVMGTAVGAAGTYVYKDEPAKQWVVETSKKLKEAAVFFMDSMKKSQKQQQKPVLMRLRRHKRLLKGPWSQTRTRRLSLNRRLLAGLQREVPVSLFLSVVCY